jgi:hypothetical protein
MHRCRTQHNRSDTENDLDTLFYAVTQDHNVQVFLGVEGCSYILNTILTVQSV